MIQKKYILENLDCANCASKIEERLSALKGIHEVSITYTTKQMRVTAKDPDELIPDILTIVSNIEPDIIVKPNTYNRLENTAGRDNADTVSNKDVTDDKACNIDKQCSYGQDQPHKAYNHKESAHHEHDCSSENFHDSSAGNITKHTSVYLLENLGCANCAAKMEKKINELEGITEAVITFTTKKLKVTTDSVPKISLLPALQIICADIEPDVIVVEQPKRVKNSTDNTTDITDNIKKQKKKVRSEETISLITIGIGILFFIGGKITEKYFPQSLWSFLIYAAAYVILGGRIVIKAGRNLIKGQIFDENFLMSLATLSAFVIRDYPEAVGVMIFYRIGEWFEVKAVEKSRSQIMDAIDLRPEVVNLVVNDTVEIIDAEKANVGDILLIRPGDRIPLDGIVVEGESRIDTSPITGEPIPVKAMVHSEVTSGCMNTSGMLKIRVEKILEESMVTRILDSVENAAASKPKIDRFITRFARVYTPFVVGLALVTAIVPSLITGNWQQWIYTAITFLVISCPCALVLSVPLAFFCGIGAGSKKGILFKGGVALEAISKVKTIVMDKTGTITKGNFIVQQVISVSDISSDTILALAASCEQTSTHPIAASIVYAAREKGLPLSQPDSVEEIAGKGMKAALSAGEVLCGNRKLMELYNIDVGNFGNSVHGTEVFIGLNGMLAGYFVISDTIKEDAVSAIRRIKSQGITTAMLTGDSLENAQAIAKETGVEEVHAKLLPEDKLNVLRQIRGGHGCVMFVGDGINDAPVLAGADVGAAMGSGADAAIEAADLVFMTSGMAAIPQSIAIAKITNQIAKQNVVFALTIKIMVMILGLAGFANMWMAVFADTGVAIICILNSIRILYKK